MNAQDRINRLAASWTSKLVARLGPEQSIRLGRGILDIVDDVSANRWDAATKRAEALPGTLRPERIEALTRRFARQAGATGAAAGAAAATPLVGTATTLAATMGELALFTSRAGDLVLTIAALHGREAPTVDERRAWVLAVLIYGSSARDEFARAVNEVTTGGGISADSRIPVATLQMANRLMARTLVRRYGTSRALVSIGRLLPLGVGAAVGGTANVAAIRSLAREADTFFAHMPYSAINVESADITDRQLGRAGRAPSPHTRP
jgi:hypothetical protein